MDYFDRLMLDYYRVLNNAWKRELRDAAYTAITHLSELSPAQRLDSRLLDQLMEIINQNLGEDFRAAVTSETKAYIERSLRLGLRDVATEVKGRVSIGLWGLPDQHLSTVLQEQNLFWIANHYDTDISTDFRTTLTQAIERGYTKEQLADALKTTFADLGAKSQNYWQGLAEHTALRIREFGRLSGYEKAGAKYYRLVNPMDDRTSDICRALVGAGRLYPLNDALQVRDQLMAIDMAKDGMESARDQIKAVAPWVKESQIVYNPQGEPTGVQGAYTPFPPFHWKCRTTTEIVI